MKKLPNLLFILILSGCLGALGSSNTIEQDLSTFDNSTSLRMTPGWVFGGELLEGSSGFKLGLFWNSKAPDTFFINAVVIGTTRIQQDNGLQFNVDGEIIKLSSSETFTDFWSDGRADFERSSKPFYIQRTTMEKILNGKNVKVRLVTGVGNLEGDFKAKEKRTDAAITGFKKFIKEVDRLSP